MIFFGLTPQITCMRVDATLNTVGDKCTTIQFKHLSSMFVGRNWHFALNVPPCTDLKTQRLFRFNSPALALYYWHESRHR